MKYDFKAVEAKWQKVWQDEHTFHAEIDHSKPKFYALVEFRTRLRPACMLATPAAIPRWILWHAKSVSAAIMSCTLWAGMLLVCRPRTMP